MNTRMIKPYVLAGVAGAVAVVALTMLIYGTFFQNLLEQFQEISPEVEKAITRDNVNFVAFIFANLAHGFLIATVVRWGRFFTPLSGACAAAVVAFLTEAYFLFTQYAIFKTMSLPSAILDTAMWTFINVFVGALAAWIFATSMKKEVNA
ncbi:hypothetical protein M8Z33_09535 [Streptomyces sp. ZAF1911]|uniref:hypothetical protein n=1 Tax=Streptomyces sp. ZAF1911 TaxID=2944129 RepID=UPI00237AC1AE|nr:hypothetical protein [Streptomyces sp. ZAF1911]MDD9376903.1 hypothetical protein [Streptomyces sp. ZAF1911]